MIYRLITARKRDNRELDAPSDLVARQFAMADRKIDRVETETGRVVYRKTTDQMPDIDMDELFATKKGN